MLGLIFCFWPGLIFSVRPGLTIFFQPGLIFFSDWCGDSPSRANYTSEHVHNTSRNIYEIWKYNKCVYFVQLDVFPRSCMSLYM